MHPSSPRLQTILVLSAFLSSAIPAGAAGRNATILVWSDLHGKVPPGLKVLVDSAREAAGAAGRPLVALDGGDALFGSRLSHITSGVAQTAELNFLKPDASTLGLGDFDWNRGRLDSLLRVLDFPVLTSNLRRNVDDAPIGGKRSTLVETAGLKIGVVGVSDPDLYYPERQDRNGDMRVDPEEDAVSAEVAKLRQAGADPVVVLCHASEQVAAKLAHLDGVDLVLGSRDIARGSIAQSGAAWIASVPAGGTEVLRIDLEKPEGGAWTASAAPLSTPRKVPLNAAWKAMNASHDSLLAAFQSREVGVLKAAWTPTRREGPLGDWMADALRGGTGADMALVPASWIRKGFPKGRVRVEDVWNAIPPGLNMVSVFTLPGSDVMKFLERQMRRSKEFLFVSGLSCTPDSSMFGGSPISAIVGGKALDKSAYYRIAIPKQLRNDIYELTGISEGSAGAEWTGLWESDVVVQWALTNGLATPVGKRVPAMYGGTAPK